MTSTTRAPTQEFHMLLGLHSVNCRPAEVTIPALRSEPQLKLVLFYRPPGVTEGYRLMLTAGVLYHVCTREVKKITIAKNSGLQER